jgi:hypothetical protein
LQQPKLNPFAITVVFAPQETTAALPNAVSKACPVLLQVYPKSPLAPRTNGAGA